MYPALSPQTIGIRDLALPEAIALAQAAGYAGLVFDMRAAADLVADRGIDAVRELFTSAGVRPAHWPLPVAWRQDDHLEAERQRLPALAALGRDLGCTRVTTGIPPGTDGGTYDENVAWHAERLRPVAEILNEADCTLGIEFIGPTTFRAKFRDAFIYSLDQLMAFTNEVGTGNVGVLLDAWHLYTSGGEIADIDQLATSDVVVVHVNDAPAGIYRDEQIDNARTLPMETGVIDLPGFMTALRAIGYDGPVVPEPFSQRIDDLAARDPLAAAREAKESMDALWAGAGLA